MSMNSATASMTTPAPAMTKPIRVVHPDTEGGRPGTGRAEVISQLAAVVPASLRERAQWVCWAYVERDGKPTKCPINPIRGGNASSTDPNTWGTFAQAVAACQRCTDLVGVGFVFTADDPFAGVDLDNCIDGTNQIKPWGTAILQQLDSYSEISPSSKGVKVFLQAHKAGTRCRKPYEDGEVELYDRARFFAVTGQRLDEYAADIMPRQEAWRTRPAARRW